MSRDPGIQTLRGVAVLLMVAGHVIGSDASSGLTVTENSGWRLSYRALEDLRMPLFAALSGFVYAYRPAHAGALSRLIRGKARRLLIPLLTVGVAFFAVQAVAPGVNNRPRITAVPEAFLFGPRHLWFLQALFLIFVTVGVLDVNGALDRAHRWAAATLAAGALSVLARVPDHMAVLSVNGAIRLLPLFLLGYGAHRYAAHLLQPRVVVAATAVLIPVYALRLWTIVADVAWHPAVTRLLSLSIAVLAVAVLLAVRDRMYSGPLAWIGGFSFGIYLLHVFGAAGARVAAMSLGIDDLLVLFLLGMAAGVILPIVFEVLFGGNSWISWGVLGQKPAGGDRRSPLRVHAQLRPGQADRAQAVDNQS